MPSTTTKTLGAATGKALRPRKALGGDVHVLVAGHNCKPAAEAAAKLAGVAKVLIADAPQLEHGLAEEVAALIVAADGQLRRCRCAARPTSGKNICPRVAAALDVMQISDITKVVSPDTFERPIYAGNAIQTVQSARAEEGHHGAHLRLSVGAAEGGSAPIETIAAPRRVGLSTFEKAEISRRRTGRSWPSAKIVISGGRGLQSGENFKKLLEPVADALGAAVGASRAAVDAGFVPNDTQVGQTGKVVAPELYMAVGISGAIQHLAGMKDSKVIVAINKDGEAPIFQVADYGLVADLFQALPELEAELKKAGQ